MLINLFLFPDLPFFFFLLLDDFVPTQLCFFASHPQLSRFSFDVVLQKPSIDVRFLKEKEILLSERHALFAKGTVAEVLKNSSDCFIC